FSKIQGIEVLIPQKKYCTDNAGMIAKAAWFRYKNNFNILMPNHYENLNPVAHMRLDEEKRFD
ncbi:MAG: hypothetical protein M0R46_17815, partial [Candidatus Muirbacterium halophilum]|nr:hypothetical protein [Candidatus Muirbacterium halophilum]